MKTVWDNIYSEGEWLRRDPHPEIGQITRLFEENRIHRILDIGSGGGRHTVYLASKGFDVYGLDSSAVGLAHTINLLNRKGLSAHLTLHDMTILPYDDKYFDAVISIQVIYHNRLEDIHKTIGEITRVLKEKGIIWITMAVSKTEPSTRQEEIEPGTFIPLDGNEKGLPHHYFKMEEIPDLFTGYQVIDLHIDDANHCSLVARKYSK